MSGVVTAGDPGWENGFCRVQTAGDGACRWRGGVRDILMSPKMLCLTSSPGGIQIYWQSDKQPGCMSGHEFVKLGQKDAPVNKTRRRESDLQGTFQKGRAHEASNGSDGSNGRGGLVGGNRLSG